MIHSAFPDHSGGRENWLFHVLRHLDAENYSVSVYSYQSDGRPFYDLSSLRNLKLVRVPTLQRRANQFRILNRVTLNLLFWLDARLFVRRVRDRLLRDWGGGPVIAMNSVIDVLPILGLKRRRPEARIAASVRGRVAMELALRSPGSGPFVPWLRPLLTRYERRCLRRCDLVLANGFDTRDYLESRGVPSRVVPNGVDFDRFARPAASPAAATVGRLRAEGRAIVMMVATLRGLKGVYDLLQAAKQLKDAIGPRFAVVFVGKGEPGRYRRRARALGVEDCVRFAGEQKDVPAFLALADVSACLSAGAGMSMAALESMAAGRAIVAWDTPVYRQLIEHGVTGVLVPEGDAEVLAGALANLIDEPERRETLGRAAQTGAREYDWPVVTRKLIEALQLAEAHSPLDRR
ncbi:MAG: glycosyltransferase family 4 protein [Dehalococcoidia bacterium]